MENNIVSRDKKTSRNKKILYYLILISSITGAWTVLPKYNKIYAFHILVFIYTMYNLLTKPRIKGHKLHIEGYNIEGYRNFFIVWYVYMIITFFWSESTFYYLKNLGIYTIMFYYLLILIGNNQNIEEIYKTLRIVAICYSISIFIGLLEGTTNFRLWGSPHMRKDFSRYSYTTQALLMKRPTAFFHNTNNFATFIFFGISFLLSHILYSKEFNEKLICVFLLIISLPVLYLTNSRANFIAVLIVFLLFFFSFILKKKTKYHVIIFLILFAIIILLVVNDKFLFLNDDIINIIKMIVKVDFSSSTDNSINFRVRVIRDALDILKDKPFGVGCGNGQYIIGKVQGKGKALSLHNWFLEILLEFGIVFFISYMVFYISILLNLFKCIRRNDISDDLKKIACGCIYSLIGFLIAMTSPSGVIYFFPFWMVIGISLIVINISRKSMPKQ